ncbi:hypothetical protein G3T14_10690 [Methylobacterium sp. BTF04]|uniref:hypothetical protein n=1 Tax=Methylobacterium sp. BTF04 TaxID=2708300 RepID=UPI0013D03ADE|nr:hypothetical protein [Methylobacterium sp. BTF04]NEU12604.1 hypothetical protein [Methylobacterium sp. BTF04]
MTDALATLRGIDLRERLVASRLAVRDHLAAHPSVALRDEIAAHDLVVSAAMRAAIEAYESLVATPLAPEPPRYDVARSTPRVGLPEPRRLPTARPVTQT